MIYTTRVVLAWSVVVAAASGTVCNQTGVTREESAAAVATLGIFTEAVQYPTFSGYFVEVLRDGFYRVYLSVCEASLAAVAYSLDNGSQFTDCVLCNHIQDGGILCIEKNSAAKGVQYVIVPPGVKVKIGAKEDYIENFISPLVYDNFTRQNQQNGTDPAPVNNGTNPSPSEPTSAATVSTTVFAVVVVIAIILLVGCIIAFGIVVGVSIHYYRKARRLENFIKENTTRLRGNSPDAEAGSLQQIGVDQEPTDECTDDPSPAVDSPARKTPSPVLKRGSLERPSSQTSQSSEPASPALHVAQNREMPTMKPEDPGAPQVSLVEEDSNQKDTTARV